MYSASKNVKCCLWWEMKWASERNLYWWITANRPSEYEIPSIILEDFGSTLTYEFEVQLSYESLEAPGVIMRQCFFNPGCAARYCEISLVKLNGTVISAKTHSELVIEGKYADTMQNCFVSKVFFIGQSQLENITFAGTRLGRFWFICMD